MKVFILCAGEARRFGGTLKQLLKLGDTCILGRQLTQLNARNISPTVVTLSPEIKGYSEGFSATVISPPLQTQTTCDTILFTEPYWDEHTIILLGDTIYSNRILDVILTLEGEVRAFGHKFEMFALSFHQSAYEKVIAALRRGTKHPFGKVRHFYHEYVNVPWDTAWQPGIPPEKEVAYYVNCNITRDVDSPEFYRSAIRELITGGRLRHDPC